MTTVERAEQLAAERGTTLFILCRDHRICYRSITLTRRRGGDLRIDTIERLCGAFQITMEEFFHGWEENKKAG